jgi:hypothetical protein
MGKCISCKKEVESFYVGNRCKECVHKYKLQWQRKKNERKCEWCQKVFLYPSSNPTCSMKCRLLNGKKEVNGCWEWQGTISKNGYGKTTDKCKHVMTHRLSYEIFKGPIEEGKNVCHNCDNRKCINPEHLWLGTDSENMQDAKNKKRLKECTHKKFNEMEVNYIRHELKKGLKMKTLADFFKVSITLIWFIKHNMHYKKE